MVNGRGMTGTSEVQGGPLSETTQPYVDQRGPDDVLLSFRYILPWFNKQPVVDIGCSTGSYLALCPPGSVGLDISRPNLHECEQRGLHAIATDLNGELPFDRESVPAILCSHVLEHVDAPIRLLRTCSRMLKKNG